jgi:hypothetical protein
MVVVRVADRTDDKYPLTRAIFDDPCVLYHGTWSTYSNRIDRDGFIHAELPFSVDSLKTISNARDALDLGSYGRQLFFSQNGGGGNGGVNLSMADDFWAARQYSTDGGGEVVRIMLREARELENLCASEEARRRLVTELEEALKKVDHHEPTRRVIELLKDEFALEELCNDVRLARRAIEAEISGGFPVVYAIRVVPEWFGKRWERHLYLLGDGTRSEELRCARSLIGAKQLVGKAEYPHGTSSTFSPGESGWDELKERGLVAE